MKKRSFVCIVEALLLLFAMDIPLIVKLCSPAVFVSVLLYIAGVALIVLISVFSDGRRGETRKVTALLRGNSLLAIFLSTVTLQVCAAAYMIIRLAKGTLPIDYTGTVVLFSCMTFLYECIIFFSGIGRLYVASTQLGIKWRLLGIAFGYVPIANLVMLGKIMRVTTAEAERENERELTNILRAESAICKTRYPILLVHGVFFRDFRYLGYWGRIPRELTRNGATVYFGEQESAQTVEYCARQLAERVKRITDETGCGKVNIIAHSKGGLDARYMTSRLGIADRVASITTINTPHMGCIFADELMKKISEKTQRRIAKTYNSALSKLGDRAPDFLSAVRDLTKTRCLELDPLMPDIDGVRYQSVMSSVKRASGGRFPLNFAQPLVKHYDGENDGLVSVQSGTRWSDPIRIPPGKKRGVTHADMIDLNRENIDGFDVREFYIELVRRLAEEGL